MNDLIVLAADSVQRVVVNELLTKRLESLRIRRPDFKVLDYETIGGRDGAVFKRAHEQLRGFTRTYQHALVLLDCDFDSQRHDREILRLELLKRLCSNGWSAENCEVIAIFPEVEAWMWIRESPHVERLLGISWDEIHRLAQQPLRAAPGGEVYWVDGEPKPRYPKELLVHLRRTGNLRVPPSAAIAIRLISDFKVSLDRCYDPSFALLRDTLRRWFSES